MESTWSFQSSLTLRLYQTGGLDDRERGYLEDARSRVYPDIATIKQMGMSCALPGSLLGSIYTAVHAKCFVEGIRFSMKAGGDNCSRNIVIGALLAAEGALESIPEEWKQQTKAYAEVEELADRVVSHLR